MATAMGDLVVRFGGDTTRFTKAVNVVKGGVGKVKRSVGGMSRSVAGAFGVGGGGGGGMLGFGGIGKLLAGVGVGLGFKQAIDSATEAEQAEKKLQGVLAATGNAAGFSSEELVKYASELQKVTNFGDEATVSAMGVLASFSNVRGDNFKRATELAQDLASVMGTDLQGAASQIGKALNDPVAGMSKLSRMGINFTDQQKQQIKAMQESGDLVGAQNVMLDELSRRFGGTARKMADPMKQAMNALDDLMEKIGALVKPIFVAIISGVTKAMEWVSQFGDDFKAIGRAMWSEWTAIWGLIKSLVGGVFSALGVQAGDFERTVHAVLKKIEGFFNGLAFVARNAWNLVKLGLIDVATFILKLFPKMEQPILQLAKTMVSAFAGVKAYLESIASGGSLSDAYDAMGKAYAKAGEQFQRSVENRGGLPDWLKKQREDIQKAIDENERQRQAAEGGAKPKNPWEDPTAKGSASKALLAAAAGARGPLSAAQTRGSREAYSTVAQAWARMQGRQAANEPARQTARHTSAMRTTLHSIDRSLQDIRNVQFTTDTLTIPS